MERFVKAYAGVGNCVVYETSDRRVFQFSGGSRNWRNTNPGNVRATATRWLGQIGEAGGFCVFSTPEYGRRVVRKILQNRAREGKTLAQAIASYAPSSENDTEAYIASVEAQSGVARTTPLAGLPPAAMLRVAEAIFRHEGSTTGRVTMV